MSDSRPSTWDQVRRRLRMQRPSTSERSVCREEAEWFLNLPDKIKRRHFTGEEQIWMRAKSELAMFEGSTRWLPSTNRPVTAPTSTPLHLHVSSSVVSLPAQERFELPAEVPADFGQPVEIEQWPLRSHPVTFSPSLPVQKPTPSLLSSPSLPEQKPTPSLHSIPSSSSVLGLPQSPRMGHVSRRAPPSPINTSSAIYIGDPENMSKVREFLSSPRLVYGPTSLPCKTHTDHTFLDASRDDGASSSTEANDPLTPDEPRPGRAKTSYFSLTSPFHSPAHTPGDSPFDDLLRSDMTLKLTLTRPDIRSDDFKTLRKDSAPQLPELNLAVDEMDPLALDPLVFTDDTTGRHGPFTNNDELAGKKRLKGLFAKKRLGRA